MESVARRSTPNQDALHIMDPLSDELSFAVPFLHMWMAPTAAIVLYCWWCRKILSHTVFWPLT